MNSNLGLLHLFQSISYQKSQNCGIVSQECCQHCVMPYLTLNVASIVPNHIWTNLNVWTNWQTRVKTLPSVKHYLRMQAVLITGVRLIMTHYLFMINCYFALSIMIISPPTAGVLEKVSMCGHLVPFPTITNQIEVPLRLQILFSVFADTASQPLRLNIMKTFLCFYSTNFYKAGRFLPPTHRVWEGNVFTLWVYTQVGGLSRKFQQLTPDVRSRGVPWSEVQGESGDPPPDLGLDRGNPHWT